ncbi:unnamed protein product [Trifolium pratense]|uniref:Uncharacterized protein n=1 Tax=Trifolium pratense TaxID=57577 RepID=A0ACB0KRU0_TRIPR|nr:unnamed protein product [Trifolium pratense]
MGAAESVEHVEHVDKISLKVMVDKKRHKVVYAEAGKDFVDVLLSFLTLPLGTIARHVAKESNIEAVKFGSISSLYQSLKDLNPKYLWNPTCKEMLLYPRNSMEAYCRQLRLNIDDTEPVKYFVCENLECNSSVKENKNRLSLFRDQKCGCGKVLNIKVSPKECLSLENGFAKVNASFIISDDLYVMPNVFGTVVYLHQKHKITNIEAIAEKTVEIGKKEVIDILKLSLVTKTPLTDFVFKKNLFPLEKRKQFEFRIREVKSDKARQMSVKIVRRKSTGEILFVEAGEDFIDFVFSFLTFPLGGVSHMLEGFSSLNCIDSLYKSVYKLSPDIYLMSQAVKEKLSNPPIAAQFELSNQILPICAVSLPVYYYHSFLSNSRYREVFTTTTTTTTTSTTTSTRKCYGYSSDSYVPLNLVDPKFSSSKSSSSGEYVKGPSIYMVTDDLVVSPISSFNAISHLNSLNVPLLDVEEKVVRVGPKEGLCILKASLTSTSALTNGLNQFIRTTIEKEKLIK